VIIPVLNKLMAEFSDLICMLVPHEPTDIAIEEIEQKLEFPNIRYSRMSTYKSERCIVVNRIGVLASLYAKAHFAYVGGSFKQNVHNVMEPAVFGIPVFYGPVHKKSFEAVELSDAGGSIVIENAVEFEAMMRLMLTSDEAYKRYSETASKYVQTRSGATTLVVDKLTQYLS
jgi:3-deoxy-D-manno-octulosonic-acid transferase